ncbi:hypothetical protein QUA46_25720 [Microcoleus sp. MON2_D6]|uniref:hypothetical protein n=1 Tax=unclassified Microcoleus TaxID=2642155 RepID=UPI002FCF5206
MFNLRPLNAEPDEFAIEIRFPECQYIANGLDPATAYQLGNTYRAGNFIEPIGDEVADRISNRLNQMQSQRTALRK